MYKIIIADDEGIVTQALEYIIKKNFGGECQVYVAKNGRQAIELAERYRPDIALLDIQMPGINGLKATEEIRARNPNVKTLILTAYDNIDYAKTALRLGAADYLNKPINKGVLVERLTALMREIDQERRKWENDLQEKEKLESVAPLVENSFVLGLMVQNEYQQDSQLCRKLLNIEENYGLVMVLESRNKSLALAEAELALSEEYRYLNSGKIARLIKIHFSNACVSSGVGNKAVCLLPQPYAFLSYEGRSQMVKKAENLARELNQVLSLEIKIGIGGVKPWDSMYESYQEALNALRHGKWTITHIDDLIVQDAGQPDEPMEETVAKAVMSGMEHLARREATVYAGWLMKNQNMDLEEKRLRMMELYLTIRRRIQEECGAGAGGGEELNQMILLAREDAVYRNFVHAMENMAKLVVIRKQQAGSAIQKAQEFIRQNFQRDLPLEEVACAAGLSPYYFSRMFKEETGTNYSEYLTEVRIETAKKLLTNPDINIKQVCIQSGYTNPNYFSRIFKKSTGITPTEFRSDYLEGQK